VDCHEYGYFLSAYFRQSPRPHYEFCFTQKNLKISLDSVSSFMVKRLNLKLGSEMDQRKGIEFSGGYYFYWYFYAGVCPPPGS